MMDHDVPPCLLNGSSFWAFAPISQVRPHSHSHSQLEAAYALVLGLSMRPKPVATDRRHHSISASYLYFTCDTLPQAKEKEDEGGLDP
jgi:hypothetical protein